MTFASRHFCHLSLTWVRVCDQQEKERSCMGLFSVHTLGCLFLFYFVTIIVKKQNLCLVHPKMHKPHRYLWIHTEGYWRVMCFVFVTLYSKWVFQYYVLYFYIWPVPFQSLKILLSEVFCSFVHSIFPLLYFYIGVTWETKFWEILTHNPNARK